MNAINSPPEHHAEIDCTAMLCPMPLIHTKLAMNHLDAGEVLLVMATDAGTGNDFVTYCELAGHRLESRSEEAGVLCHWIRKGSISPNAPDASGSAIAIGDRETNQCN